MSHSQTFELLTPCFCAGFSKSQPELRVPSIRGQLRWWMRALQGERSEYAHFGGIKGKALEYPDDAIASLWKLTLSGSGRNAESEKKTLVPHKKDRQGRPDRRFEVDAIPAGNIYTLTWQHQPHPEFTRPTSEDQVLEFTRLLKVWMLLGTVGRRATRAMGSVWPISFMPTIDEFSETVAVLSLPATIRWKVLDQSGSSDALTKIAGETVHGLQKDQFEGNPLGFVKGSQRKSSPLRFKVGRFSDGLRLIALWDSRPDRCGNLAAALAGLVPPLRELMADFLSDAHPVPPTDLDPVEALLHAPFVFDSIAIYSQQVTEWQSTGETTLVRRFVELTQSPKYGGLRQQPWYPKL